jgi:hypothetical protein
MAKNWPADQAATQVHLIYQRVLERSADNSGLITWGCFLDRGEKSIREVVRLVGQSQEYYDRFIAPVGAKNAAILMYRHFLAREPESAIVVDQHAAAIIANWQTAVNGFVNSAEYTQRFGEDIVPHP